MKNKLDSLDKQAKKIKGELEDFKMTFQSANAEDAKALVDLRKVVLSFLQKAKEIPGTSRYEVSPMLKDFVDEMCGNVDCTKRDGLDNAKFFVV